MDLYQPSKYEYTIVDHNRDIFIHSGISHWISIKQADHQIE